MMTKTLEPLVADLLRFVATPRPYAEVIDAWRTSCPRLPVWEEAVDGGLVAFSRAPDGERMVRATDEGARFLRAHAS